jgi:hypothetical protein
MIGHSQDASRDLLLNVTGLLIPELQPAGAFGHAMKAGIYAKTLQLNSQRNVPFLVLV